MFSLVCRLPSSTCDALSYVSLDDTATGDHISKFIWMPSNQLFSVIVLFVQFFRKVMLQTVFTSLHSYFEGYLSAEKETKHLLTLIFSQSVDHFCPIEHNASLNLDFFQVATPCGLIMFPHYDRAQKISHFWLKHKSSQRLVKKYP